MNNGTQPKIIAYTACNIFDNKIFDGIIFKPHTNECIKRAILDVLKTKDIEQ